MHTSSRWTYGLIAVLLLLAIGLAFAAPIDPASHKADPTAKYISRAVENRDHRLYAGPGLPTAKALRARERPSLLGPLPERKGKTVMPALVRIADRAAVAKMRAKGCSVGRVIGDLATARIPVDQLAAVANIPEVSYVKYAPKRNLLLDVSVPEVGADVLHDAGFGGQGVIVGVVDTGIDWRHPDFINPDGTSRILYLWDQSDPIGPSPDPPYNYGTLWTNAEINAALQGMGNVREADTYGHGTHVAGIAAGNGLAPGGFVGMAPEADLIVVKVDFDAGATDDVLVDGNGFIADMTFFLDRPAVINNSWGGHYGEPHDGTSFVETMLSDLTWEGTVIVAAAGNEGVYPIHAGTSVNRSRDYQWHMWALPGFSAEMAIDIWYPLGTELAVSVAYDWEEPPPEEEPPVPPAPPLPPPPPPVVCSTAQTEAVVTGDIQTFTIPEVSSWEGAEVTIDATNDFNPNFDINYTQVFVDMSAAMSWEPLGIVLTLIEGEAEFDAWVSGGIFLSYPYEFLTTCMTDPLPGFFVVGDNLKTVSPPSTGDEIISVGSYNTKCSYLDRYGQEQDWCSDYPVGSPSYFTSRGPRRDDARKPDISAPGAMIASALSQDASEASYLITPDGQHVVFQGTSMACPHVTGAIALMLEKDPFLAPDDVRHYMLLAARPADLLGSGWDPLLGWGMLDVPAAVALVPGGFDREPEISVDFTAPVAAIGLKYGVAEINWPAEFSGIAFDQDVVQPIPIPLDNLPILENHWALNEQIVRVIVRPEDVPLDPDGTYNFLRVDPLIQAVIDAGAKPMICVPEAPLTWTNWQFATWLYTIAVHFAADHDLAGWYWEILDQADIQEWEPLRPRWDPWEYALMFNQVYDSLKQVAPQSKVGGPGLSEYDGLYVETILRAVRVIDFISLHAEGATTAPRGNPPGVVNTALHSLGRSIDRTAALIARWKPGVEIVANAYGLNAWRPVIDDFGYVTVDADPRMSESSGAAWSLGALCQLMLSPLGNSASVAVYQEATDGLDDTYSTPGSLIEYDPFFGRGLWFADVPGFLTPAFHAQQLFGYFFPTGSRIVQAHSSDPYVLVLASSNGDPAANVAIINVSPRDAIAEVALTGLPYFEGTSYRVDDYTFPLPFVTEPIALDSVQTVQLAPYGVRIINIRDPYNALLTPGLDVGGSVAGDKSVARDWTNHDGARHPEIYVVSTQTKYSGYASQGIVGGEAGGGVIVQTTPVDSVDPGSRYEVSAYVRPRNVVSAAATGAFVRVEFLDQLEQPLDPPAVYQSDDLVGAAISFQKLEVLDGGGAPGVVAPVGANRMKVELVLEAESGTAFFDQVYAGLADVVPVTPPGGTVVGTVLAQDLTPVGGAKVSLVGQPQFAYTRSDGTYQIDFVPAGTYSVVAAKDGYQTETQGGQSVADGVTTQVDFVLRPTGGSLRITSITAGESEVAPGQTDVEVTMLVDCLAKKDVRVSQVGLRFVTQGNGFEEVTGDYTVVADPANPKALRPGTTDNAFRFLVSVGLGAQPGDVLIDGFISGYLNLVPNGSFEAGTEVPPPGWDDAYIHAEIDQETAYEGTNSHHHWLWKDEDPPPSSVTTLNPVSVQGNATYRVGVAYKDQEVLGRTTLYYRIYEYDELDELVNMGGWGLDHSADWLAREGLYRVLPETRSLEVEIGMVVRSMSPPFPVPEVFTADLWVDDVFIEPDAPITDTAADLVGFWTVVGQVTSLTLGAGWNMISLPADPLDADPAVVFAGIPIDRALYRYDLGTRGYVGYRSDSPGEFGPCRASEGYWLYLYEPASVSYVTAGTRSQQITVGRPGWALVGLPRHEPASIATCLVDTGMGTLMMPEAADAGWLELPMYFYASGVQGYGSCALEAWADDDALRAWLGYWLYSEPPAGQLTIVP